jgi:hypothetical protein
MHRNLQKARWEGDGKRRGLQLFKDVELWGPETDAG